MYFLGRIYDDKTNSWKFKDDSGKNIPDELRQTLLETLKDSSKSSLNELFRLQKSLTKEN